MAIYQQISESRKHTIVDDREGLQIIQLHTSCNLEHLSSVVACRRNSDGLLGGSDNIVGRDGVGDTTTTFLADRFLLGDLLGGLVDLL